MLMSAKRKIGAQDFDIQDSERKILFLQTQSAHTNIALKGMGNCIGEIAQSVHDVKRPRST